MTIIKDLQAISKKLAKLAEKTEKLAAAFEQPEISKAKSVKEKTKSKTATKKGPAKAAKKTDTDKVLAIINRFKKGVDTAALMKKTGFNQKKVRNILARTYKQGKIARTGKGIYKRLCKRLFAPDR